MVAFTEPKVFDPLKVKPENRTMALALMIGVIIFILALDASVMEKGVM